MAVCMGRCRLKQKGATAGLCVEGAHSDDSQSDSPTTMLVIVLDKKSTTADRPLALKFSFQLSIYPHHKRAQLPPL